MRLLPLRIGLLLLTPHIPAEANSYNTSDASAGSCSSSSGSIQEAPHGSDDDSFRAVVDLDLYPIDDLDGEDCQRIIRAARWVPLKLGR
jgi:hypothetical protein